MANNPVKPVVQAVQSALHHVKIPTSRQGFTKLFRQLLGEVEEDDEEVLSLDAQLRRKYGKPAPEPLTPEQKADIRAKVQLKVKEIPFTEGAGTSELAKEGRKGAWLGTQIESERLAGTDRGTDPEQKRSSVAGARTAATAERARRQSSARSEGAEAPDTESDEVDRPVPSPGRGVGWREAAEQEKADIGLAREQAGTTAQVVSDNVLRDLMRGKTRGHILPLSEAINYQPGDTIRFFDEVTGEEHIGEIALKHHLSTGSKYTVAGSDEAANKKARGARAKLATEKPRWYGWPQKAGDSAVQDEATFLTRSKLTPEQHAANAAEEQAAQQAARAKDPSRFLTGSLKANQARLKPGETTRVAVTEGKQPRRLVPPDERETYGRIAANTGYPTDLIYRLSQLGGPQEQVYLELRTKKRPNPRIKPREVPLDATAPSGQPLSPLARLQQERALAPHNELAALDPGEQIVQPAAIDRFTPTSSAKEKNEAQKAREERGGSIKPVSAGARVPGSAESGVVPQKVKPTDQFLVGQIVTRGGIRYKVVHAEPTAGGAFGVERELPGTSDKSAQDVLPTKRVQHPGTKREKQWNAERLTAQNVILEPVDKPTGQAWTQQEIPGTKRVSLLRRIYPSDPEAFVEQGYSILPPDSTRPIQGNPGVHLLGVRPDPATGGGSILITQPIGDDRRLVLPSGKVVPLPPLTTAVKDAISNRDAGDLSEVTGLAPDVFAELTGGLTRQQKGGQLRVLTTGFKGAGRMGFYGGKMAGIPHEAHALGGEGTPLKNPDGTPQLDAQGKPVLDQSDADVLGVPAYMVQKGNVGAGPVREIREKVVDESDGVIIITTLTDGKGRPKYQTGDEAKGEEWHGSDGHFAWIQAADSKKPVYVIDVTKPETINAGKIAHWAYINGIDTIGVVGSPLNQLEDVLQEGTHEARLHVRDTLGQAFKLLKNSRGQTQGLVGQAPEFKAPAFGPTGRMGMDLVGKEPNQTFGVNVSVRNTVLEQGAQNAPVIPARHVTGSAETGYEVQRSKPFPEGTTVIIAEGSDPTQGGHAVTRIISGFQDGVDITGIQVGKQLGYEVGGWAPKSFITSTGPKPQYAQEYGAKEHPGGRINPKKANDNQFKADLRDRTVANAQEADGTVWFGAQSGGWYVTREAAKGKAYLENPTPEELRAWLIKNNIKTLNVAGNRPHLDNQGRPRPANDPLASQKAEAVLREALGPAAAKGAAVQAEGPRPQVFVFGSNTEGRHGMGAALAARKQHGAVYGQAEGPQGQSYAIITKDLRKGKRSIPLPEIGASVTRFLEHARDNPGVDFNVTAIGTKLAGYTPEEIAPFFRGAPENVKLPPEFAGAGPATEAASAAGPAGWARTAENRYEVSTAGDKRFSALNARLKDGRTIEEAYQLDIKGYRSKGNDWRIGKGKAPLSPMTPEEQWTQYKGLWEQWASENPDLIADLRMKSSGKTLTDKFASTDVSQARALSEILSAAPSVAAKTTAPVTAEVKGYVPFDKLKALSERLANPNLTTPEVMDIKSDMRAVLARDSITLVAPGKGDTSGMRSPGGKTMHDVAPGEPGWLGNPYKWAGNGGPKNVTVQEVIAKFERDFHKKIASDPAFREAVLALRGKKVEYYKWEGENNHLKPVRDWLLTQPVTPPVRTPGGSRQVLAVTGPWDPKTGKQTLTAEGVRPVTYDKLGNLTSKGEWIYNAERAGVPEYFGQMAQPPGGKQTLIEAPIATGTDALVRTNSILRSGEEDAGIRIPPGSEGNQAAIDVMPAEAGSVAVQDRKRIFGALEDGIISPRHLEVLEANGIIHPSDQVGVLTGWGFKLPDFRPIPQAPEVPSLGRAALPGTTQAPDVVPPPLGSTAGIPFEVGMRPSQLTGSTPPGPHIPASVLATPGPHIQALGAPPPRMDERLVDVPIVGGPSPAGKQGPARLGAADIVEVGRRGALQRPALPAGAVPTEAPLTAGGTRLIKDPAAWARRATALLLAGVPAYQIAEFMKAQEEQGRGPDLSGLEVTGASMGPSLKALARIFEPLILKVKAQGGPVRPRVTDPIAPTMVEPYRTEQEMRNAPRIPQSRLSLAGGAAEAMVDARQILKEYNEDWSARRLAETGMEVPAEVRSDKQADLEMGGGNIYEEIARKESMGDVLEQVWKRNLASDLDGYLSANITTRSLNALDRAEDELEQAALQSRLYGRSGSDAKAEAERIRNLPPEERAPMGATREQADAARAEIRGRRTPEEMAILDRAIEGLDTYVSRMLQEAAKAGLLDPAVVARILAIQDPYARIKYIKAAQYNEDGTYAGDLMTVLRQRRINQIEQKGGKLSVTEEAVVNYLKGANAARRPTESPLESTIKSMEEMGKEIARNKAAKSLTFNLRGDPLASLKLDANNQITNPNGWIADITDRVMAIPEGYSTVSYMEQGLQKRLLVPQEVADAMNFSNAGDTMTGIAALTKTRGLLQALATSANFAFLVKNMPRDILEAFILTPGLSIRDAGAFGKVWARNFVDTYNDRLTPQLKEFKLARASQSALTANLNPRLTAYQPGTRNPIKAVYRGTQNLLNATEEATKSAVYKTLRSKGISQDQAAWWTRNFGGSPDFAKRGRFAPAMSEWVMFFNPQIQGTARTIAAYKQDPWKLAEHLAGFTIAATALDTYNRQSINPETGRPDIEDVPEDQRKGSIIIMDVSGKRETNSLGESRPSYVRLSLPHAAALLYTPILDGIRLIRGEPSISVGEAIGDTISNMLPGSLKFDPRHPFKSTALSAAAAIHPVPKVAGEIWGDVNALTGTPIEGRRESQGLRSERSNERSSPFFREVGRAAPWLPLSPLQMEHVYRSFLPGLGEIGLGLADTAIRSGETRPERVQSEHEKWIRTPIAGPIGRGWLSTTGSQTREDLANRMFDTFGKVRETVTSLREQAESSAPDAEAQYTRILNQGIIQSKAPELSQDLGAYVGRIGEIAKEKQDIQASDLPLANKEEELKALWREEFSILKEANQLLDENGIP